MSVSKVCRTDPERAQRPKRVTQRCRSTYWAESFVCLLDMMSFLDEPGIERALIRGVGDDTD